MKITQNIFESIVWDIINQEKINGETGFAIQKTILLDVIRIRMVEYSPNFQSDHWCNKGHIIHCLEGEIKIYSQEGNEILVSIGQQCIIGDEINPHQTYSALGCKLLIID